MMINKKNKGWHNLLIGGMITALLSLANIAPSASAIERCAGTLIIVEDGVTKYIKSDFESQLKREVDKYRELDSLTQDYLALHMAYSRYYSPLGYDTLEQQFKGIIQVCKILNNGNLPNEYKAFIKKAISIDDAHPDDVMTAMDQCVNLERQYPNVYPIFSEYRMLHFVIREQYDDYSKYGDRYLEPILKATTPEHYNEKLIQSNMMDALHFRWRILNKGNCDVLKDEKLKNMLTIEPSLNTKDIIAHQRNVYKLLLNNDLLADCEVFIKDAILIIDKYDACVDQSSNKNNVDIYHVMQNQLYQLCWEHPNINPSLADPRLWHELSD